MFKSIESFKIAFPYYLGCRPNYTSQAVLVTSPVKIRLWLYYNMAMHENHFFKCLILYITKNLD